MAYLKADKINLRSGGIPQLGVLSGYEDLLGGAGVMVETVKAEVCNDIDRHENGELRIGVGAVASGAQHLDDSIDYKVDCLRVRVFELDSVLTV